MIVENFFSGVWLPAQITVIWAFSYKFNVRIKFIFTHSFLKIRGAILVKWVGLELWPQPEARHFSYWTPEIFRHIKRLARTNFPIKTHSYFWPTLYWEGIRSLFYELVIGVLSCYYRVNKGFHAQCSAEQNSKIPLDLIS